MNILFFIATFNALFFTVLLLQKKPRAFHDNILIGWLVYLGLYIGGYAFYSHDLFTHFHLLSISLLSLLLLFGPFLHNYILALVTNKKKILKKDLLHLVPFVLFNLYILMASFTPTLSGKLNMEKIGHEYDPPFLFIFFLIITACSGTAYFIWTILLFKKLDIHIFNHYSNAKDLDLYWIRKLVLIFGITWTALISVTVIHHVFHMFSTAFCTNGLFLSISVFVILIGYFGLKQKIIYGPEETLEPEEITATQTKYSGSRLNDTEAKQLAAHLKKYIESVKSYLNPDLTLAQLAEETNMSSHLLSQVINEQFKLNFFDFINQYRVSAFEEKMTDPNYKHFSLLGIAFESGFNSKSAFNRTFKKVTGLTPSQYKETAI